MSAFHRLWIVVVAMVLGGASAAWACPVTGRVVCTGTDTGVAGVQVTISATGATDQVTSTDSNGYFSGYLPWVDTTWDVTLDVGGVVVPEPSLFCTLGGSFSPTYQVDACGEKPADCSPGYYKNHPENWCSQCGYDAAACAATVQQLGAKGSGSAAIRDFAKSQIDACFGTAAASPCSDD